MSRFWGVGLLFMIAPTVGAGCQPAKTPSEACRRQNAWNRVGRSTNPDPRLDALENMRCDEMEREERRQAREDQQRAEDRAEREQARREVLAAVAPPPPEPKSASTATTAKCALRSGHYVAVYREQSGDCGPRKTDEMNIKEQPLMVEPPCRGRILYSADNCSVHFESACPEPKLEGASAIIGDTTWSADGSEGNGSETLSIKAGDGRTCTSVYDVRIIRN